MKHIIDFFVAENQTLPSDYFLLELKAKEKLPPILPGQFLQLRIDNSNDVFLRRPFSIHDVDYKENQISLLIHKVGKGSRALANLKGYDTVNAVLPLGTGFSMPKNDKVLLIGGGCGVAPILYLAKYLNEKNIRPDILLAARNSSQILRLEEYARYGKVHIITNDGSMGEKGLATEHSVFEKQTFSQIYCCGPDAMMRAVAQLAKKINTPCEVSLEKTMACGFGACLCCVTEGKNGHVCVCKEGPVFKTEDLKNW